MKSNSSGSTLPLWLANIDKPTYAALNQNITTDVCIIGAGITGLTAAYCLLKAGKQVVVVEDGTIGSGETGRTTAHISNALDDRYFNIEKIHGKEISHLAAQSHTNAIAFIETLVQTEQIDCDFMRLDGHLFAAEHDSVKTLKQELAAAQRAGIEVNYLSHSPSSTFDIGPSLVFPHQAQFHPIKYLNHLAQLIIKLGGKIFESTHASEIVDNKSTYVKTATHHLIHANTIIQATNAAIHTRVTLHTKIAPYRSYVIAAAIPADSLKTALYWDTTDPYHYIRLQMNHPILKQYPTPHHLLIVGGADHRTGVTPTTSPFVDLEQWLRKKIPVATDILFKWSGQVLEPVDYLAFIGPNLNKEKNVYIATGDSGNGITHGTLAGILLTELITQHSSKTEAAYSSTRFGMRPVRDFLQHNLEAMQGYIKYLSPTKHTEIDLLPGQGAIIAKDRKKMAAYRDLSGNISHFDAACPHKKALLSWNAIEATWDCPAHGSRFSATGEVLNGPANCGLTCLDQHQNKN